MRALKTRYAAARLLSITMTMLALGLVAPEAAHAQIDPLARVIKTQGNVLLKRRAEADFTAQLRPAMNLFNGDAIRSAEGAFASVLFLDDRTLLKIKNSSQFQFVESQNTRTITLDYGTLRSILPEPVKAFRIETPVSVAAVKGTDFWLIHDLLAGVDRAYGIEGVVEILNRLSGIAQTLTANTLIISTATGQVTPPIPISPDEMPTDPDEAPEARPEPETETAPEPDGTVEDAAPGGQAEAAVPDATIPLGELLLEADLPVGAAPAPEVPVEEPAEGGPKAKPAGPSFGLGLGSVTLDGTVYYQLALRPELNFGKWGIGLDIVGYLDAQGNFRKDEWDEPSDYLDKVLYLRYGSDHDPLFFKIGAMPRVQYGFGALMDNYSNMTEFPQVRRVGFELGGNLGSNFNLRGFSADLKEFGSRGGLVGLRGTYKVSKNFPLTLGVNLVADLNQYGGLKDKDGDGVPNLLDDFPEDNDFVVDSDGDGLADLDPNEFDIDGDGITDTLDARIPGYTGPFIVLDDSIATKPDPFNKENAPRSILGASVDLSYPILSRKTFNLVAYAEAGMLNYESELFGIDTTGAVPDTLKRVSGFGLVGPGLRAQILGFINVSLEYRYTSPLFQPGFFNTTYDFERAQFISSGIREAPDSVVTKDQALIKNHGALSGYFGRVSANLLNLVTFGAAYQQLKPVGTTAGSEESNSFVANLSLNPNFIPKVSEATAYYIRTNDPNPFAFGKPSANTTWGYRLGYQLGSGVSLVYSFQESYRDLNGNGRIETDEESVRLLSVETAFNF